MQGFEIKRSMGILRALCRKTQEELKIHARGLLERLGYECEAEDGYIFATHKDCGKYVLLVAHLDTVHSQAVKWITTKGDIINSPQGIGGDDRAGVYIVLELAKKYHCPVLFTEDEEIGAVGAVKALKSPAVLGLSESIKFIVEFDRKGDKDAVYYDCDNSDFEQFISSTRYFKTAYGSFSDISEIAPELGIAAVNLSAGYYNAHTLAEYINVADVVKIIAEASKIFDKVNADSPKYEYIASPSLPYRKEWDFYGYAQGGSGNNSMTYYIDFFDKSTVDYQVAVISASNEHEALGKFFYQYTDTCYNNIYDIYSEEDWLT